MIVHVQDLSKESQNYFKRSGTASLIPDPTVKSSYLKELTGGVRNADQGHPAKKTPAQTADCSTGDCPSLWLAIDGTLSAVRYGCPNKNLLFNRNMHLHSVSYTLSVLIHLFLSFSNDVLFFIVSDAAFYPLCSIAPKMFVSLFD